MEGASPGLGRHIIQCQARSRRLGPGQKPGQGGQDGGCTHPSLGATHHPTSLGLLPEGPTCCSLPPYLPGICQSHLIPTPFLSMLQGLSKFHGA